MNKPKISDFKNPSEFAAACVKYAEGLAGGDPGGEAERADEDDRADAPHDPAPTMGTDPAAYIRACEAHLARRLDGKAHEAPRTSAPKIDPANPGQREDGYLPEEWARMQAAGKLAHEAGF